MAFDTFKKKGKMSRMSKDMGADRNKDYRGSHPGAKFDCPGAPDPMDRKIANRYRKASLGEQQYAATPKPEFDDSDMNRFYDPFRYGY